MINEELMPIAWHPIRWFDWCLSEDFAVKEDVWIFLVSQEINDKYCKI